jgi:hypothetical protein
MPGWDVALERTRGLTSRLSWDSDINNLIANAYLQGAMDVGLNPRIIETLARMHAVPDIHSDDYHGA